MINDDEVIKATGKSLKEWFEILDKAGAKDMNQADIARFLKQIKLRKRVRQLGGIGTNWWTKMIASEYKKLRS